MSLGFSWTGTFVTAADVVALPRPLDWFPGHFTSWGGGATGGMTWPFEIRDDAERAAAYLRGRSVRHVVLTTNHDDRRHAEAELAGIDEYSPFAFRRHPGERRRVPLDELEPGDVIWYRKYERFATIRTITEFPRGHVVYTDEKYGGALDFRDATHVTVIRPTDRA